MKETPEKRWWDLPAAAVLVVALGTAASRLVATDWTPDLELSRILALLGVFAGLALGRSMFRGRVAAFFALVYGLFLIPWLLGSDMSERMLWSDRLMILFRRLETIIRQLIAREVVFDSLLFIVLMAALFWILGVYAGFALVRTGNAWRAVLPAGLTLFAIHTFDAVFIRRAWYLAMYLFFTLVLVARMSFLQQHSKWRLSRTSLPPNLGFDFIRYTLLAAGLIVLFSWTAPALANTLPAAQRAWAPVREAWNETKSQMDNAFASLRSSVGVVSEYYGDSISLGSGNRLTQQHMFTVNPPRVMPANTRYYWRAQVYQTYSQGKWTADAAGERAFNPQLNEIKPGEFEARADGLFEITAAAPLSTLFTPANPVWVSRMANTNFRSNPDGTVDISTFRAQIPISPGETYETRGSFPSATVAQLREDSTDYPDWITERYLQLPETVTDRTIDLAEQITVGLENPYDKTAAITAYLRENIRYSETIPTPPRNQELMDWFLFELRSGYCEYYATAEVVMLRSIGIPARMVAGYAQGERQASGDYYVRQRDAHTWVEAYFPTYGWVEFEPTAGQPEIVRRQGLSAEDREALLDERAMIRRQLDQLDDELLLPDEDPNQLGLDEQGSASNKLMVAGAYLLGGLTLLAAGWRGLRVYYGLPPISIWIVRWMTRMNMTPPAWLHMAARRASLRMPATRPIVPPLAFRVERLIVRLGLKPPEFIARWSYWSTLPPLLKSYVEINRALGRLGRPAHANATPAERATLLSRLLPPTKQPASYLVGEYQQTAFGRKGNDRQASEGPEYRGTVIQQPSDGRSTSERPFIERPAAAQPAAFATIAAQSAAQIAAAEEAKAATTAGREIRRLSYLAAWKGRWQQLLQRLPGYRSR